MHCLCVAESPAGILKGSLTQAQSLSAVPSCIPVRRGHLSAGVCADDVQGLTPEPIAPPAPPGAAWPFRRVPPQDLPRAAGAFWHL